MTLTAKLLDKTPRVVHGRDWRDGLIFTLVFVLTLGLLTKWDDAAYWEEQAKRASADLRNERLSRSLPSLSFVIEAPTHADAMAKLAAFAGKADALRYENRHRKN